MLFLTAIVIALGIAAFVAARFGDRLYDRVQSVVNIFKTKEQKNDGTEK